MAAKGGRSTLGLCETVLVGVSEAVFRPSTREPLWLLCDGTGACRSCVREAVPANLRLFLAI
jgi:hypothetical protein